MAHLMRRAGFGAARDELEALGDKGFEATVEELLHPGDPGTMPDDIIRRLHTNLDEGPNGAATSWMYRMITTNSPLEEKLSLDGIMWDRFELKPNLENLLRGRFRAVRDQVGYKLPALLRWRARSARAALWDRSACRRFRLVRRRASNVARRVLRASSARDTRWLRDRVARVRRQVSLQAHEPRARASRRAGLAPTARRQYAAGEARMGSPGGATEGATCHGPDATPQLTRNGPQVAPYAGCSAQYASRSRAHRAADRDGHARLARGKYDSGGNTRVAPSA